MSGMAAGLVEVALVVFRADRLPEMGGSPRGPFRGARGTVLRDYAVMG